MDKTEYQAIVRDLAQNGGDPRELITACMEWLRSHGKWSETVVKPPEKLPPAPVRPAAAEAAVDITSSIEGWGRGPVRIEAEKSTGRHCMYCYLSDQSHIELEDKGNGRGKCPRCFAEFLKREDIEYGQ